MACTDCPINMAQAEDDCYWIAEDKGCRLKQEQARCREQTRVREQAESDRKIGENMRDYWICKADLAE